MKRNGNFLFFVFVGQKSKKVLFSYVSVKEEIKSVIARNKREKKEEKKMTQDGKFLSIEDFRANATGADYEELWNFYQSGTKNFPTTKEPKPECRFQFSSTAAKKELDEWRQRKKDVLEQPIEAVKLTFTEKKQDFRKHSLLITEEQWNRLQKVYDQYPVMGKQYVLHAFLEYSLTRLGV